MVVINIDYLNVKFPDYTFTIKEIVDEIFKEKLDDDVRSFAKSDIGIDRVYKSYDLRKMDVTGTDYIRPDIKLNDMWVKIAEKAIKDSDRKPSDIGLLTILGGNQQYMMPAPTVEMVSKLGLSKDVRTQNFQGLACSSFSEALQSAAGYFALGNKGDVLVLGSQYTTEWYLNMIRSVDKISMTNKKDFYAFVYFLIFSDIATVALISNQDNDHKSIVKIDTKTIFSRKDTSLDGYTKAKVELVSDKNHQMAYDFELHPGSLKRSVADLSSENISNLQKNFPTDFNNVKFWGLHTAGTLFVDYVIEKCGIDREKAKFTFDVMRETGNTGSCSSLQLIKESLDKKILKSGEIGCIVDFGWEGADSFLYYVQ